MNKFLGLLAVAALVWIAAPALTTARYIPGAVDFRQDLPTAERVGKPQAVATGHDHLEQAGPVLWRTPVIDAPKRFDLVGVAGATHDLEIRVRDAGEAWSSWVVVTDGNPLYAGGAEQAQIRSRHGRIEGELHYVNVTGDTTRLTGMVTGIRSALNSAVVAALGTASAEAFSPAPRIITREEWGATRDEGGCEPRVDPDYGKVKAAVIHHTVSSNDYTEAEALGMVLGICRFHRNGNGWNDIGYNAVVDRFGNVYEGRAGGITSAVIGAQAQGHNSQTTGVAVIGNHSTIAPSPKAKGALAKYLAWKLDVHGIPAKGNTRLRSAGGSSNRYSAGTRVKVKRVFGHGETNHTACPGSLLGPQVGRIRRRIDRRMKSFADQPPPPGSPAPGQPSPGGPSPGSPDPSEPEQPSGDSGAGGASPHGGIRSRRTTDR